MAGATGCFTRSQILQPGEPFILPPGATLIGATNVDALDSLCTDLIGLETFQCYVAMIGSWDTSGETGYWQGQDNRHLVLGYDLNDVRVLFTPTPIGSITNIYGCFDGNMIAAELRENIPGIIATAGSNKTESGVIGDIGNCLTYVLIQTIPSIANNLKLVLQGTGPLGGGAAEGVIVTTGFRLYSTLVTEGYVGLPVSPCVGV